MAPIVEGKTLKEIFENFGELWRALANHHQLRWVGPEKGVSHLAIAGIINALWDLWGKLENKPVWRLLLDLTPEQLVNCLDFRYVTDFITKEEAISILKKNCYSPRAGCVMREKTFASPFSTYFRFYFGSKMSVLDTTHVIWFRFQI